MCVFKTYGYHFIKQLKDMYSRELAEAEPVAYDVIDTEKGVQAVNVKGV